MASCLAALQRLHGLDMRRVIGHGGEAQVHSAVDGNGKSVAVKLLKYNPSDPQSMTDAEQKAANEAIGWRKIGYDTQTIKLPDHSTVAFVMPLLTGKSLKQHAREGAQWSVLQGSKMAVLYFEQLSLFHSRRIGMSPLAHRDLKPSNVMIVERQFQNSAEYVPVIIDWGAAHVAKGDGSQDRKFPGKPTGSRGYFGPDIYKSKQTYEIDVYASIPIVLIFLRYQGDCSVLKSQYFDQMMKISRTSDDILRRERRSELYEKAARAPFPIVEVAFEFYRTDPQACNILISFLARMQSVDVKLRPTSLQCLKFFLRLHEYFFLKASINSDSKSGDSNSETKSDLEQVLSELASSAGVKPPQPPTLSESTSEVAASPADSAVPRTSTDHDAGQDATSAP